METLLWEMVEQAQKRSCSDENFICDNIGINHMAKIARKQGCTIESCRDA